MREPLKSDESYQKGIKLLGQGKAPEAEECFRAALREQPDWPEAHNNLGVALASRNRHDESLDCFRRAIDLKLDYADAHHNLGNVLRRVGKAKESIEHYEEAVRLKSGWSDAYNNFGLTLRSLGQMDRALEQFRKALRANPRHPEARNNLGVTLTDKGLLKEAAAAYRQVLRHRPNAADTHNNLGVVLVQQGKLAEAVKSYRRSLELRPKYADAQNNLGNALRQQGLFEDAEASLREALQIKPDYAEAYNNLAIALVKQERMEEAVTNYRQALQLKPDYPDAHKNLGLALLGTGEFAEGWTQYEWRWQSKDMPARKFDQPRWDGQPLEGKTILLYAEQGLGDTLQFIRYALLIERQGGRVLVECQKALIGLLERCPGIFRLVPHGEKLPEFQAQAPLMSLPGILGTSLDSIPAGVPYLSPEPDRVRAWGEEFKGLTGFKIGIAWQGSQKYQDDKFRSIRLVNFEPLARLPGTRLVNLQKGYGAEQLGEVGAAWGVMDFGKRVDEKGAFLDTAAIMKHLDLVVTSDSAMAHLAGALGVPVWLAVSKAPDWRWLLQREDSPWYPTMRLFRQTKRGEWRDVFERMAHELEMRPPLESAERYAQRGLAHLNQGQNAEAIAVLRRAIDLDPKNAILHNNLAVGLEKEGKKDEAVASFREAVRLKPDYGDALHNLGNQLRRLGRLTEAEEEYRKALKLMPNSPDLCNHLGIALLGQAKHSEAEACFRRSLRLKPDHAEAFNNLGVLLEQLGRIAEATESYQASLRSKPDSADTHKNLALSWLMRGEFNRGWAEYEWRWKCAPTPARSFPQPRWDGRPLEGKAVLIYAEQGLGDTIQFIRYAPLVQQRGGVVFVECPGILEKLLARCPGVDQIIPQGTPQPDFAYQIPFLSLPAVFHTTIETVPADTPYLSAAPHLIESWGKELDALDGFKIGIAWQGSQKYGGDAHRSIPLKEFEPLTKIDGVRLVSLQKGFGSEQLGPLAKQWNILDIGDRLDANGAFVDTAAIMTNLDLVVTSDTAVAHLAGALGVPVWMAVSMAADWRWLRVGDTSPWYPTMRLFRQTQWGNWADVFQRIAHELRSRPSVRSPLLAEIAPGELLDKITILEIKRNRTTDERKLQNIRVELGALLTVQARGLRQSRQLERLAAELKAVNENLWQIEDDIRLQERAQNFGARFVELARSVYHQNDKRAAIKKQINQLLGSMIVEEKSYESYCAAKDAAHA